MAQRSTSQDAGKHTAEQIEKYNFSLPILLELNQYLQKNGKLSGVKIGWHCHLTEMTAAVADVLLAAGAQLFMSECNADTTSLDAVAYMEAAGAKIYLGSRSCDQVLSHRPLILSDTGFVLIETYLRNSFDFAVGASEITTSGITRLRSISNVTLPVININDGTLKTFIENFHGVGEGLVDALFRLTDRVWAGRPATVIGYGRVGAGVAHYLQRAGAAVTVVESDPVRRLVAHYDGFQIKPFEDALAQSQLVVTATGKEGLLNDSHAALLLDGVVLANVGHWKSEIDVASLRSYALETRSIRPFLEEIRLSDSKKIYIAAEGSPVNVAMLSGSAEATLIHLTTEALCMNYLTELEVPGKKPLRGELPIPNQVEHESSKLALKALRLDFEHV